MLLLLLLLVLPLPLLLLQLLLLLPLLLLTGRHFLTTAMDDFWQKAEKYNWISLLEKFVLWGLIFFCFSVGVNKIVMVLLSQLNAGMYTHKDPPPRVWIPEVISAVHP